MNTREIPKTWDLQSISKYFTFMRTLFSHPFDDTYVVPGDVNIEHLRLYKWLFHSIHPTCVGLPFSSLLILIVISID